MKGKGDNVETFILIPSKIKNSMKQIKKKGEELKAKLRRSRFAVDGNMEYMSSGLESGFYPHKESDFFKGNVISPREVLLSKGDLTSSSSSEDHEPSPENQDQIVEAQRRLNMVYNSISPMIKAAPKIKTMTNLDESPRKSKRFIQNSLINPVSPKRNIFFPEDSSSSDPKSHKNNLPSPSSKFKVIFPDYREGNDESEDEQEDNHFNIKKKNTAEIEIEGIKGIKIEEVPSSNSIYGSNKTMPQLQLNLFRDKKQSKVIEDKKDMNNVSIEFPLSSERDLINSENHVEQKISEDNRPKIEIITEIVQPEGTQELQHPSPDVPIPKINESPRKPIRNLILPISEPTDLNKYLLLNSINAISSPNLKHGSDEINKTPSPPKRVESLSLKLHSVSPEKRRLGFDMNTIPVEQFHDQMKKLKTLQDEEELKSKKKIIEGFELGSIGSEDSSADSGDSNYGEKTDKTVSNKAIENNRNAKEYFETKKTIKYSKMVNFCFFLLLLDILVIQFYVMSSSQVNSSNTLLLTSIIAILFIFMILTRVSLQRPLLFKCIIFTSITARLILELVGIFNAKSAKASSHLYFESNSGSASK